MLAHAISVRKLLPILMIVGVLPVMKLYVKFIVRMGSSTLSQQNIF